MQHTALQDPSKWGGAIELSILSQHLKAEIAAFDIQVRCRARSAWSAVVCAAAKKRRNRTCFEATFSGPLCTC